MPHRARPRRLGYHHRGPPRAHRLDVGASESTDAWKSFLDDLVGRGLRPPLLAVSDGAPGLIAAVELVFAESLRQRCTIHRARNILPKVPTHAQEEVKAAYWKIFDMDHSGERAIAIARNRAAVFSRSYEKRFPAAVECLNTDLASLFIHLRFPVAHHKRIRHSNFISSGPSVRPAGG